MVSFGTVVSRDVAEVHQDPGLQADRLRAGCASGDVGLEFVATPRSRSPRASSARITTTGMPLSIRVQSTPAIAVDRVRRSAAARRRTTAGDVLEVEPNRGSRARHAGDRRARRSRRVDHLATGKCAVAIESVLTMWIRTLTRRRRHESRRPRSMANGADAGQEVAAVLSVGDEPIDRRRPGETGTRGRLGRCRSGRRSPPST